MADSPRRRSTSGLTGCVVHKADLRCALLLLLGASPCAWSATANWLDVESRIEYGYFTEDARSLDNIIDSLSGGAATDAMRSYYQGLAHYRLALLSAPQEHERAKTAATRCTDDLGIALGQQPDAPEALALESACEALLTTLQPIAPLTSVKSNARMRRALEAAPKNPRVLLLDAVVTYERPGATPSERTRVIAQLQKSIAAFELERRQVDHAPGWGAAEAYAYLGRTYLDTGDALAARAALEHALLIAPDFQLARRMMYRITTG